MYLYLLHSPNTVTHHLHPHAHRRLCKFVILLVFDSNFECNKSSITFWYTGWDDFWKIYFDLIDLRGPAVHGLLRWAMGHWFNQVTVTLYCAGCCTLVTNWEWHCTVLYSRTAVVHLTTWARSQSPHTLLIRSCAVPTCMYHSMPGARCESLIWGSLCQVSPWNPVEMWRTRYLTDQQAPAS